MEPQDVAIWRLHKVLLTWIAFRCDELHLHRQDSGGDLAG